MLQWPFHPLRTYSMGYLMFTATTTDTRLLKTALIVEYNFFDHSEIE